MSEFTILLIKIGIVTVTAIIVFTIYYKAVLVKKSMEQTDEQKYEAIKQAVKEGMKEAIIELRKEGKL